MTVEQFELELARGERYSFGQNWEKFLSTLNAERLATAEQSLRDMLGVETLEGKTFLDIGSGSGLFSLGAVRLGAKKVCSFDFDPDSVACTREVKRRFAGHADQWTIGQGSVLDTEFVHSLGQWDVVYSWGVLHHTGDMWRSLDVVVDMVVPGGLLFISIYNDQGRASRYWTRAKRLYSRGKRGGLLRAMVATPIITMFLWKGLVVDLLSRKNPLQRYTKPSSYRGMSVFRDWWDWLGGYPFEVAKPEEIFAFYQQRGFELLRMKTSAGNMGPNEFVFRRGSGK